MAWSSGAVLALVLGWLLGTGVARAAYPRPPAWWLRGAGACIRQMESTDGRASANLYGMLDGWAVAGGHGWAGDASRGEQDYRAFRLWQRFGWEPWRGRTANNCT